MYTENREALEKALEAMKENYERANETAALYRKKWRELEEQLNKVERGE